MDKEKYCNTFDRAKLENRSMLTGVLREELGEFDGNAISFLSETMARHLGNPNLPDAVIELLADDDPLIQRSASWMWLEMARERATITSPHLKACAQQLARLSDWQAVLTVLQSFDCLDGPYPEPELIINFAAGYTNHKRPFLRAWAINTLCRVTNFHPEFIGFARSAFDVGLDDPAASVRARLRNIPNFTKGA